jgi:hypothetical protein
MLQKNARESELSYLEHRKSRNNSVLKPQK